MIPYKHNLLALAFIILFSQMAFSQVKKQYKDETFAQTTIVIKESKTDATDQEILNAQFDIDDFGMDQVIRITTKSDRVKVENAAPATPKATPAPLAVAEVPAEQPKTAPAEEFTEKSAAQPTTPPAKAKVIKTAEAPVKAERNTSQTRQGSSRSSARSGSSQRSYSKSKRSYKNKRFKKKKRKRTRSGKKYKCYKF